jgi:hypothetical protein
MSPASTSSGEPDERAGRAADPPHRVQVALPVQRHARAVIRQVDRQLRHPQYRLVDAQQLLAQAVPCATVPDGHPPGQAQVAVEPGVQQRSAVRLQVDDLPAEPRCVRMLLDPQVGAVGVAGDDPERGGRPGRGQRGPGDHRAAAHGQVATRRRRPGLRFVQHRVPGHHQPRGDLRGDVERRGRAVHERALLLGGGECARVEGHDAVPG